MRLRRAPQDVSIVWNVADEADSDRHDAKNGFVVVHHAILALPCLHDARAIRIHT